ncbi:SulP family inorganic anion transporter [Schumannella soli]|uniref:SulP family inorganic anion transporter n=1 Tax=Schumannella soli TaxID=2590779 RepID=A0A506XWV4_9MICO|nr:SulP family inorganic anion transporter [Schumannella soli]TPW74113.1 SulP family inorganic anion transporter [Schumannella soli]
MSAAPTRVLDALRSPRLLTREALAGLVTAFALIPEAISFAIVAGVDPRVGLFASFTTAVAISIVGGRPAMISAAAGSVALVMAPLVASHGLDYLIAAVLLGGVIQVAVGLAGFARIMRFVPRSVMVGFVNALAILIFLAQLRHLIDVPWAVYPLVAVGVALIVLLPKLTRAVPSPLIAIVAITATVLIAGIHVPTVGDEGALPEGLPLPGRPNVPLTLETLGVIAPYALGMAAVGLLESLLTARLVDEITETRSSSTREAWGQGVANLVTGIFGGMGTCAMIGQTMINVKTAGARTRLSTFFAGVFLLVLVVALGGVVGQIPMAALVAVMIMVSATTFDWHSIRPKVLKRMPLGETLVMVTTVVVVVATNNLAIGVGVGVLAAALIFARRVARFATVHRDAPEPSGDGVLVRYRVEGELFFASSSDLVTRFDYAADQLAVGASGGATGDVGDEGAVIDGAVIDGAVEIDLSGSHIWDASTVVALDAVAQRYRTHGIEPRVVGLNAPSAALRERLGAVLPGR